LEYIDFKPTREVSYTVGGETVDKKFFDFGGAKVSITYEVDEATSPKHIKILFNTNIAGLSRKIKTLAGIMKFTDNDNLLLRMNFDDGEIPTNFTKEGTATLTRVGK